MKLYTEEELLKAIQYGRDYYDGWVMTEPEILKQLTPIEIPSDEEIEQRVTTLFGDVGMYQLYDKDRFIDGAKWLKEQILNQKK